LWFPVANLAASHEGEDGDDTAIVDVERRPVDALERRRHLVDLVREEAHEVVLPGNAHRVRTFDADGEVPGAEERAARSTAQPVPVGQKREPVALGDTFREWL